MQQARWARSVSAPALVVAFTNCPAQTARCAVTVLPHPSAGPRPRDHQGGLAPQPALHVSNEQGTSLLSAPTFSPGISSTRCGPLETTTWDGACGPAMPGGHGGAVIFWEGRWGGGEQQLAARWRPGSPTQRVVSAPSA